MKKSQQSAVNSQQVMEVKALLRDGNMANVKFPDGRGFLMVGIGLATHGKVMVDTGLSKLIPKGKFTVSFQTPEFREFNFSNPRPGGEING